MSAQRNRTVNRIAFHQALAAEQTARLATLPEGSKAHARCAAALAKNEAMVEHLMSLKQPAERSAPKNPRGPRKGISFEIVVGDEESVGAVAVPFGRGVDIVGNVG